MMLVKAKLNYIISLSNNRLRVNDTPYILNNIFLCLATDKNIGHRQIKCVMPNAKMCQFAKLSMTNAKSMTNVLKCANKCAN